MSAVLASVNGRSPFLGRCIIIMHRESRLQLNRFSLNGGVRERLDGRDYRAVDMILPTETLFIDRVTRYAKSPKSALLYVLYSLLKSRET